MRKLTLPQLNGNGTGMAILNGNDTAEAEIRARLVQLVAEFPQAEIARRTGTSRANVSRYLRTNRIPASFAARCVVDLGVNPEWLLTGKGSMLLADSARGGEHLTGELLNIVQALNAVGQLRIGALGGKHHLRMLRELSDAVGRYGTLKERLNHLSVPVLRTILHDAKSAVDKGRLDFARDLCRTASQLESFCDDPDLAYERAILQGKLELLSGNVPAALELFRRAIYESIRTGALLGTAPFNAVVECVAALHDWGRAKDALRLARAASSIAMDEALASESSSWLDILIADIRVHSGELNEGIKLISASRGKLKESSRLARANAILAQAMLYAGAIDVGGAVAIGGELPEKAGRLLGFALFTEDAQSIETALRHWESMRTMSRDSWLTRSSRLILDILRGERAGMSAKIRQLLKVRMGSPVLPVNWAPILGAQMYRLIGRANEARRCMTESKRLLDSLPDWLQPGVMWWARHHRNVLEYGSPADIRDARAFFRHHLDQGYLCFQNVAIL